LKIDTLDSIKKAIYRDFVYKHYIRNTCTSLEIPTRCMYLL